MAQKPRGRRSAPSPQSTLLRNDVAGLLLVAVSVFTLLSLLTGSRGALTGAWVDLLRHLTGSGVWLFALACGGLGLWLVVRAIERMPNLAWQRPTGLLLLFLAYITGTSLWMLPDLRSGVAAPEGAGGLLGTWLADLLAAVLTVPGAWIFTAALALVGLVLLTDRLLVDLALAVWDEALDVWDSWRYSREVPAPVQPPLVWDDEALPWWQRMLALLRGQEPTRPFEGPPAPASSPPPAPVDPAARTPAKAQTPPAPVKATPPADAPLTPRIVGGSQAWQLPRLDQILEAWDRYIDPDEEIRRRGKLIEETLHLFGVPADFEGVNAGPTVTQYLIRPGYVERVVRGEVKRTKVKVSKIAALANDLALALAAPSVRIEAPIPGTNYVGIEVPNTNNNVVGLRELMESEVFQALQRKGRLPIALGEDVRGEPVVTDLAKMPHLLIAGATGSGKSVCINAIVSCLLLTHTPETLRLLMIDPKMVELTVYNGIPHLLSPVVTDVDRAAGVLFWAVKEMERRYQLLNKAHARDIVRYNEILRKRGEPILPYIVVVVDEMADLMMAAPEEVEKHICRLAQMARAVGIHLIVATQRPSVDVITGLIKANFPARIAFAVTSQTDSRVILDVPGAERLLGRGDMLFMAPDSSKLERLQGAYLSDEEINRLVLYWKGFRGLGADSSPARPAPAESDPTPGAQSAPSTPPWQAQEPTTKPASTPSSSPQRPARERLEPTTPSRAQPLVEHPLFEEIEQLKAEEARDDLFDEAVRVVTEAGRASVTLLQRKLRIGYGRASRLMDQLEEAGIVGPEQGSNKGRIVYTQPRPSAHPRAEGPMRPRIIGGEESSDSEDPPKTPPPPRVWM